MLKRPACRRRADVVIPQLRGGTEK